ncbi:MAG TPA: AI-2E family transporter [Calidithermus sp.]|nr:AI-2E family transporter [Calidithermus sp.]
MSAALLGAVAALAWLRAVLLPIALAALLAFVLTPAVSALRRAGFGRVTAVLLVALLLAATLGAASWVVARQVTTLLGDLPQYKDAIKTRLAALREAGTGTALDRARAALDDVLGALEPDRPGAPGPGERPVPVIIRPPPLSLARLPEVAHQAGGVVLVLLLVVFMLLERQELRNRFIRVVGFGRVSLTTRALDEAGWRISRYLATQSLINVAFGATFTAALLLVGVPYAVLWGTALAVARFVPFVGVWAAVLPPLALSLAVFDTWLRPALVLAVFLALEGTVALAVEPVVLSQRVGLSRVALLVALGFWTWLWGPLGLVLATPLTVCCVVLARHIPGLESLAVLLSDEPALPSGLAYYQRLLAGDRDEAEEVVEEYRSGGDGERVWDEVLIPALVEARRDRDRGRLGEGEQQAVVAATREIVEVTDPPPAGPAAGGPSVTVLGCPARDAADEAALAMLRRLLDARPVALEVLAASLLSAEMVEEAVRRRPALVCVAALPPGGAARARYLIKRLRARVPDLRILVGRWGAGEDIWADRRLLAEAGADGVGLTLRETRDQILALLPVLAGTAAPSVAAELQPRMA